MVPVIELNKDFAISESSRIPYYYQLKQHFKEMIESGEWKAGQMLPYEGEICKKLNISRIVVRQAYQELKSEGYIFSRKGKGTFITEPRIYTNWMQNFMGFYESMTRLGYKIKNTVLAQEKIRASEKVAKALQLKDDKSVVIVKRIHNVNGQPFYMSTNYLPFKFFPDLVNADLTASLYRVLEKEYGIEITHSKRYIDGGTANEDEAGHLNIKKGDCVFRVENTSYLKGGIPFEYFNSIHIGERTRFIIELVKERIYSSREKTELDNFSSGMFIAPAACQKIDNA